MEILIPTLNVETAKKISSAFFVITKPNPSNDFGYLFPVWKNRQGDSYLLIDTDKILTIHPDRKTKGLVLAYGDLVPSKLPFASAQLISNLDSDIPVTYTVGELVPNELLTAYKTPKELFTTSYRPTIINEITTTPPPAMSDVELALKKIEAGNNIMVYAIALISAKNTELSKSSEDIAIILTAFASLQQLLQVGALLTTRQIVNMMSPAYPDYDNAFTFVLTSIDTFETQYGNLT